ncbi:MAG TPA: pitrilysin family protein [Bacteroidia bacterium]|nr:pitrilysin family protein [Bacteroidia bacterium]
MKKIILTLTILIVSVCSFSKEKAVAKKILPYPVFQKKLSNGLNVVTVPFESPGIAAFYIVVRVGSREEVEPGKTGFAHFFEHMMFRGTEKYSKEKYSEILKSIGASANANTSIDRTVYHMTGNATKLEKMFELEADRFMHLQYSIQDFKTEAGAVKGEYTKNYANPLAKLYETTLDKAFEKHTYKHTTMGFFNDIVDMPNQYDYSLQFFNRFYRPENATIIVVGDVKQETVNALAESYFGEWEKGDFKPEIPKEPLQKETKFVHMQVPNFPPQLELSYKAPPYSDAEIEVAALNILADVLCSERSDLYKKLVITEQKLRNLSSDFNLARDENLFQFDATLVKEADMQYAKDEIVKAVEKIKSVPVDEKYLGEIKSRAKYSFAMRMDSPDAIANSLAAYTWLSGDPESINRFYALIDRVTPQDISNAAKKYLVSSGLTISTISGAAERTVK